MDENKDPVRHAHVDFYLTSTHFSEQGFTDEDGIVRVPRIVGNLPTACLVSPCDGHWSTYYDIDLLSENCTLTCNSFPSDMNLSWWREIVGFDEGKEPIQDVKIGIIDTGFCPSWDNLSVTVLDIEGQPFDPDTQAHSDRHGLAISKIVNECVEPTRSDQIYIVDVTNDEGGDYEADSDKIGAAISLLAEDLEVDIINISGGFFYKHDNLRHRRHLKKLKAEVENAMDKGCIIIAAVGNDSTEDIAHPAAFEEVVGVGSIGQCGFAPLNTFCQRAENYAKHDESALGKTQKGLEVFADVQSCFGKAVDVVAPGLGVTLLYENGRVYEQHGTSFAAPIVTATLAVELDRARSHIPGGVQRDYTFVKCSLKRIAYDLGIQSDRQGYGMPVLDQG